MLHIPVLLEETVAALVAGSGGGWYVDGTAGAGGHAAAVLAAAGLDARMLAMDRDASAVALARAALAPFGERARVVQADFRSLKEVAAREGVGEVKGVLLDLGVSSMQLDDGARGFSFQKDAPLDMRMDRSGGETAADLLRRLPEEELAEVLFRYGEERMGRRIAKAVVAAREAGAAPSTTLELAELVSRAKGGRRGRTHPATQTFQALRIAVNGELDALERAMPAALELLAPGGRLAVISFHSLEDRMVKRFMMAHEGRMVSLARGGERWSGELPRGCRVTRKAVTAGEEETERNPRSRTAKLRVLERTV